MWWRKGNQRHEKTGEGRGETRSRPVMLCELHFWIVGSGEESEESG